MIPRSWCQRYSDEYLILFLGTGLRVSAREAVVEMTYYQSHRAEPRFSPKFSSRDQSPDLFINLLQHRRLELSIIHFHHPGLSLCLEPVKLHLSNKFDHPRHWEEAYSSSRPLCRASKGGPGGVCGDWVGCAWQVQHWGCHWHLSPHWACAAFLRRQQRAEPANKQWRKSSKISRFKGFTSTLSTWFI